MKPLHFSDYKFRFKNSKNKTAIFDVIRKKFIILTPEEWVRQHVMKWIIAEKNYPASLLAVEKSINVNGLTKRCDIVAFNRSGLPVLIIEC